MDLSNILAKAKGMIGGIGGLFEGGDDPKKKKPLSYDQINQWSDYAEANPSVSLDDLWKGFSAKYPGSGIDFNVLKEDIGKLTKANRVMGERQGSAVAENVHTGYSFPKMNVDGKDYGRVNADMKAQFAAPPVNANINRARFIPKEATEIWQDPKDNELKFVDPETGDVKIADISALNDPRVKASLQKQRQDSELRGIAAANSPASLVTQ